MEKCFEILHSSLLFFIVCYPLCDMLCRYFNRKWFVFNIVFSVFALVFYIRYRSDITSPVIFLIGSLYVGFNIYRLVMIRTGNWRIWIRILIDLLLIFALLYLAILMYAIMGDYPIKNIILERMPDGGYSFLPGYWQRMWQEAFFNTGIIVFVKYLYQYLITSVERRRNEKIKVARQQKELVKAQLNALQAKVNPHFLYNALNSIAGLALVDGERTRQMALSLSRFFRYSMNKEEQAIAPINQEVEILKTYLEIEKIRFGDKLHYEIVVPDETLTISIPRFLLQPLVENCVVHGLKGEIESLHLYVNAFMDRSDMVMVVGDNGADFADDFTPGYGIKSVYDKLDLLFPGHYSVEIRRHPRKEIRIIIRNVEKRSS